MGSWKPEFVSQCSLSLSRGYIVGSSNPESASCSWMRVFGLGPEFVLEYQPLKPEVFESSCTQLYGVIDFESFVSSGGLPKAIPLLDLDGFHFDIAFFFSQVLSTSDLLIKERLWNKISIEYHRNRENFHQIKGKGKQAPCMWFSTNICVRSWCSAVAEDGSLFSYSGTSGGWWPAETLEVDRPATRASKVPEEENNEQSSPE